jgi:hypothetical protein
MIKILIDHIEIYYLSSISHSKFYFNNFDIIKMHKRSKIKFITREYY